MRTNKIAKREEPDTHTFDTKDMDSQESLKQGLGFLLSRYLECKSKVIAQQIVIQLERLLRHSDCIGFPDERCSYYRLLKYWQAQCL